MTHSNRIGRYVDGANAIIVRIRYSNYARRATRRAQRLIQIGTHCRTTVSCHAGSGRPRSNQGYEGAGWPKCVGPEGDPAPTYLECFLIWQQPHPIFYAERCYRADPGTSMLERYKDVVFETARFMASFVVWDQYREQYRIGPQLPMLQSYITTITNTSGTQHSRWHTGILVLNSLNVGVSAWASVAT